MNDLQKYWNANKNKQQQPYKTDEKFKYSGGDLKNYWNANKGSFMENYAYNTYNAPQNKGLIDLYDYYKILTNDKWIDDFSNQEEVLNQILGPSSKRDSFFIDRELKKRKEGDVYGKVDNSKLSPVEKFIKDYEENKSGKEWSAMDKYTDKSGKIDYATANKEIDESITALGGKSKKDDKPKTLFDDFADLGTWLGKGYNQAIRDTVKYEDELINASNRKQSSRGINNINKNHETMLNFADFRDARYDAPDTQRGFLTRGFDMVSAPGTAVRGVLEALSDKDGGSFGEQLMENTSDALMQLNPFSNKVTPDMDIRTSDIFDNLGWKKKEKPSDKKSPFEISDKEESIDEMKESMTRHASNISRGALGFVGDVFTDPLTYMSGGLGSGVNDVLQGTGTAGKQGARVTTEKMAKKYLKDIGNLNPSDDLVKTVMRDMDKISGVRVPKDVTFGLGNMPFFGNKFADPKTLIKGETLASIGDDTIAPAVNKLTRSVKGSKLAGLVSNNAKYTNLVNQGDLGMLEAGKLIATKHNNKFNKLQMLTDNLDIRMYRDKVLFGDDVTTNWNMKDGEFSVTGQRGLHLRDSDAWKTVNTPFTEKYLDKYNFDSLPIENGGSKLDDIMISLDNSIKAKRKNTVGEQLNMFDVGKRNISGDITDIIDKRYKSFVKNSNLSNFTAEELGARITTKDIKVPDNFKNMAYQEKRKFLNRNLFEGDLLGYTVPENVLDELIEGVKNKDVDVMGKYIKGMPEYLDGTNEIHELLAKQVGFKDFNKNVKEPRGKLMTLLNEHESGKNILDLDEVFKIKEELSILDDKFETRKTIVDKARATDTAGRKEIIKGLKKDDWRNSLESIFSDVDNVSSDVRLEESYAKRALKESGKDVIKESKNITPKQELYFEGIKNKVNKQIPLDMKEARMYEYITGEFPKNVVGIDSPIDIAKKQREVVQINKNKLNNIDSEESARRLSKAIFGDVDEVKNEVVEEITKFSMEDAHRMAREMKQMYPDIDYDFQLSLNMKHLKEGGKPIFINDVGGEQLFMNELFKTDNVNKGINQVTLTDGTNYLRVKPGVGFEEFYRPTAFSENIKLNASLSEMLEFDKQESVKEILTPENWLIKKTLYEGVDDVVDVNEAFKVKRQNEIVKNMQIDYAGINDSMSSPGTKDARDKFAKYKDIKNNSEFEKLIKENKAVYNKDTLDSLTRSFGDVLDDDFVLDNYPKENKFVILEESFRNNVVANTGDFKKKYKEYGIKPSSRTGWAKPIIEVSGDDKIIEKLIDNGVNVYNMKPEVMEYANGVGLAQFNKDSNAFMRLYDRFMVSWKKGHTIYTPSFQVKNAVGNSFNNYLNVGAEALKPANHKEAFAIINGASGSMDINGVNYTYDHIRNIMESQNLIDTSYISSDMKGGLLSKATKSNQKGLNKLGSVIEEHDKVINFVANLKNGLSISEASEMTNKYLFDYSDITTFERNVLKRLIPFYTYFKKNVPLQISELMQNSQPYSHLASLSHAVNEAFPHEDIDESYMPRYAKDYWQTPARPKTDDGREQYRYAHFGLPYEDMTSAGNLMDREEGKKELFGRLSPALTIPYEVIKNKNYYFDQPIKKYDSHEREVPLLMDAPRVKNLIEQLVDNGSLNKNDIKNEKRTAIDPRLTYAIEQTFPANTKLSKVIEKTSEGDYKKLIDYILGLKLYDYDPNKEKHRALQDIYYNLKK